MSSQISFSGLASGIDSNSIVSQLIAIDRQSLNKFNDQKTRLNQQQTQMNNIKTAVSNLKTSIQKLTDAKLGGSFDIFKRRTATSSDTSFLGATAGSTATDDGEYLRSGAVVMIDNNGIYSWRRVLMAALQKNANLTLAVGDITVDGPGITPGATVSIYAYKGAVGLTERIVRLEGDSPWSLP